MMMSVFLNQSAGLRQAIGKGIGYIEANIRSVKDTYALALVCYVLSMGESGKARDCENKLSQTAIREGLFIPI